MNKLTIVRNENYTTVSNVALRSKELSWKAKGLLVYLLSLPDNWDIKLSDLENRSTDGRDSTNGAIKELMDARFISRVPIEEKGKFLGYDYTVSEEPNQPASEKPQRFIRNGLSATGNPSLLSTKELSTKKEKEPLPLFTDIPKKETGTKARPTLEQVIAYCEERNKGVDPLKWFNHYQSNGWVIGKALAPMKDWKAAVHTWENSSITESEKRSNVSTFQPKEEPDDSWRFHDPLSGKLGF